MADGHLNKCKECTKMHVREREARLKNNPYWVEMEKQRGRKKYQRLYKGVKTKKEVHKKSTRNYRNNYPEIATAQRRAIRAIEVEDGLLRHHWSYRDEHHLDVIILSPEDHYELHRFLTYDPETKFFLSKEGNLLDTKEKHIEYFSMVTADFVEL